MFRNTEQGFLLCILMKTFAIRTENRKQKFLGDDLAGI